MPGKAWTGGSTPPQPLSNEELESLANSVEELGLLDEPATAADQLIESIDPLQSQTEAPTTEDIISAATDQAGNTYTSSASKIKYKLENGIPVPQPTEVGEAQASPTQEGVALLNQEQEAAQLAGVPVDLFRPERHLNKIIQDTAKEIDVLQRTPASNQIEVDAKRARLIDVTQKHEQAKSKLAEVISNKKEARAAKKKTAEAAEAYKEVDKVVDKTPAGSYASRIQNGETPLDIWKTEAFPAEAQPEITDTDIQTNSDLNAAFLSWLDSKEKKSETDAEFIPNKVASMLGQRGAAEKMIAVRHLLDILNNPSVSDKEAYKATEQLNAIFPDYDFSQNDEYDTGRLNDSGLARVVRKAKIGTKRKSKAYDDFNATSAEVLDVLETLLSDMSGERLASTLEKIAASRAGFAVTQDKEALTPRSMSEFIVSIVAQHNEFQELGIPHLVSDAMVYAFFADAHQSFIREDVDPDSGEAFILRQKEQQSEASRDMRVGRLVMKALGQEGGDTIAASYGALAAHAMQEAVPHYINEKGNLTKAGTAYARHAGPLASLMFPDIDKPLRDSKKTKADFSINLPRKADARKEWSAYYKQLDHTAAKVNEALFNMSNAAHTFNLRLGAKLESIIRLDEFNDTNKIVGYKNEDGTIDKGEFMNRNKFRDILDDEGKPISKDSADSQEKAKRHKDLKVLGDNKTKEQWDEYWKTRAYLHVPNSSDPYLNRKFVQEPYHGDVLKDHVLQKTLTLVKEKAGVFYYDYFVGGNGRIYVEQYIGNFQAHKLSRALLQAAEYATYHLSNKKDINELKAGIMKKFGSVYAKMGVDDAAAIFDQEAKNWEMLDRDWNTNGAAILNLVNPEEKFLSLSAFEEGAALQREIMAYEKASKADPSIDDSYRSKFYTEIDGVANGLAHTGFQAGSFNSASATNLNPTIAFNSKIFTEKKGRHGEDVYEITGSQLLDVVAGITLSELDASHLDVLQQIIPILGFDVHNTDPHAAKEERENLRDFMKSPVMIFGYGAGAATVGKSINGSLDALLNKEGVQEAVTKAVREADADIKGNPKRWLHDTLADAVNGAVSARFADIKELTSILSQLAEGAANQGIPPIVKLQNGMAHLFGARTTERNPYKSYNADETGIAVNVYERKTDPFGHTQRQPSGNEITLTKQEKVDNPEWLAEQEARKDPNYRRRHADSNGNSWLDVKKVWPEGSHLKAATQAAVLITHNMDAINMALAFDKMIKSKTGTLGAAQVFDGAFMVPKEARAYAKALNDSFYETNAEYSYLEEFRHSLESLSNPKTGDEFDFRALPNWKRLDRQMKDLIKARKRLIAAFKHDSKYIYQFFWDGADKLKATNDDVSVFKSDEVLTGDG